MGSFTVVDFELAIAEIKKPFENIFQTA